MTDPKPISCAACDWGIGPHVEGCPDSLQIKEAARLNQQTYEDWLADQIARWKAEEERKAGKK